MKTSWADLALLYGVTALFCLGIFFFPLLMQQKEPAVKQAIIQNMVFFQEMITNYIKHNQTPPKDIAALLKNARTRNYNKTFFNPINKYTGDADNTFIIFQYKPGQMELFNQKGQALLDHVGQVGYYNQQAKYVIYGIGRDGLPVMQDGKIVAMGNY